MSTMSDICLRFKFLVVHFMHHRINVTRDHACKRGIGVGENSSFVTVVFLSLAKWFFMLQPNQTMNVKKCEVFNICLVLQDGDYVATPAWKAIIVNQSFHPPLVLASYISFGKIVTSSGIFSENHILLGSEKKLQLNKDLTIASAELAITCALQKHTHVGATIVVSIYLKNVSLQCYSSLLTVPYCHLTIISLSITSPSPAEFRRVMASPLLLAVKVRRCRSVAADAGWDSVLQVVCRLESVTGRAEQTVSRGRGITDSYADTSRITGHINSVH